MEKNPVDSEEKEESSENGREKMKEWMQENLRMIVSVVIVIVIAGGIYSYSKRAQAPSAGEESVAVSEENSEGKINVIGGENEEGPGDSQAASDQKADGQAVPQPTKDQPATATQEQTSRETQTAFVETAAKGDGTTKLARRALANNPEKNPDSSLSAEHKIYIEDYLRRQVENGHLKIGDTREFSKDMIANAIQKSKELNEKQLQNLAKYAKRVPNLT